VFKPGDEEPYAPNNPRGHVGMLGQYGFRAGVLSGEGHLREVAASLLDRDGFASVPLTTLVEMVRYQSTYWIARISLTHGVYCAVWAGAAVTLRVL